MVVNHALAFILLVIKEHKRHQGHQHQGLLSYAKRATHAMPSCWINFSKQQKVKILPGASLTHCLNVHLAGSSSNTSTFLAPIPLVQSTHLPTHVARAGSTS
jgi:hypothetical protein